jgi:hypothetical protein
MTGHPSAILMAVESTRRALTEPPRERRPRRAIALALQALAHRLDAGVAPAPRPSLGR